MKFSSHVILALTIFGAISTAKAQAGGSFAALTAANMSTNQLDNSWTPKWSNLVAYLKMDGLVGAMASPYTVPDLTGNSNGTGSAAGLSFAAGRLEQGVTFDGTRYISIPKTSPANVCTNLTIMFWVKWNATSGTSWRNIAGNYNGSACTEAGWYLQQNSNTQKMEVSINSSGGTNQSTATNASVFNGSWRHVAVTFAASAANIYIDGALDKNQSINLGTGVCSPNAPITLGGPMCDSAIPSGAMIDEFAVFNVVLTAGEISTIYNRQKNGTY